MRPKGVSMMAVSAPRASRRQLAKPSEKTSWTALAGDRKGKIFEQRRGPVSQESEVLQSGFAYRETKKLHLANIEERT
jgi:hypothetical protein